MKNASRKSSLKPKSRRLSGRGDYTDPSKGPVSQLDRIEKKIDSSLKKSSVGPGAALGRLAGSLVGQGDLGSHAGDAISKYFGFGDYDVKTNSLIKGIGPSSKSSQIPTFQKDGKRGIRVTEREFLMDVISSSVPTDFKNQKFRINPADVATFPWLSTIAQQFEEYEFLGLVFEFISTSSEFNGSSQALGTVITATDYDPSDAPYPNKIVMESSDYCKSTKSSESLLHGVECDLTERGLRTLYCSSSTPTTSADLRFSDLGNFQIASIGCSTANVNLGELWVSYDVAFFKKQLTGGQFGINLPTVVFEVPNSTSTNPLGIDGNAKRFNGADLDVKIVAVGGGFSDIIFPPNLQTGTYMISIQFRDTTGVLIAPSSLAPLRNCEFQQFCNGGFVTSWLSSSGASIPACMINGLFRIRKGDAGVRVSNVTHSATGAASVIITQVAWEELFYFES